jgi:hypothetical protein
MILLTADWHLDDQPANEYRWRVFDRVRDILINHTNISDIFVLGDMVDRRDRHSAAFVNRLLHEIKELPRTARMTILRGNHDSTLRRPAYFEFLSSYVSEPRRAAGLDDLLLLPFTAQPQEDWKWVNWGEYQCLFMHACVTGTVTENGTILENRFFPTLPPHVRIFSGDAHVPQTVGNVVFVGSPHPVDFGDNYPTRMLVVNPQNYAIAREISIAAPQKLMLDLASVADLKKVKVAQGDQVKLRLKTDPRGIEELVRTETEITRWAKQHGVTVAGIENTISTRFDPGVDINQDPEYILREFAKREGLSAEVLRVGLELLKETT